MRKKTGKDSKILQLVTFTLGGEEYAVDILKVQEINRMKEITRVPNAPYYVEGVINLRGKVIPVVSLRKKIRSSRGRGNFKTENYDYGYSGYYYWTYSGLCF